MFKSTRIEFEQEAKRSLSMPIAGAIVWSIIGLLSLKYSHSVSVFILVFATGAILPIGLVVARLRGEILLSSSNPFAKLMGLSVLMVNLLWVVHIPLLMSQPQFVPLSLGVGLGLHWVIYSWIVQHPLGLIHAVLRSILVGIAWYAFPDSQIQAICCVIVCTYLISIYQMYSRPIPIN